MNTTSEVQIRALSADEIDAVGGGNVIADGAAAIGKGMAALGIAVKVFITGLGMGLRPPCE
jgi:hypothetical protein